MYLYLLSVCGHSPWESLCPLGVLTLCMSPDWVLCIREGEERKGKREGRGRKNKRVRTDEVSTRSTYELIVKSLVSTTYCGMEDITFGEKYIKGTGKSLYYFCNFLCILNYFEVKG